MSNKVKNGCYSYMSLHDPRTASVPGTGSGREMVTEPGTGSEDPRRKMVTVSTCYDKYQITRYQYERSERQRGKVAKQLRRHGPSVRSSPKAMER